MVGNRPLLATLFNRELLFPRKFFYMLQITIAFPSQQNKGGNFQNNHLIKNTQTSAHSFISLLQSPPLTFDNYLVVWNWRGTFITPL